MKASRKATHTNKSKVSGSGKERNKKTEGGCNCKKKIKKATKTPNGIKNFMSILAEEEKKINL